MKKRCQLIEEAKPDLVISIHQNSYHEEAIRGGQVFYYKTSVRGKKLAESLQKRFDYVLGDSNKRQAKANDNYYLLLHVKEPIVIAECGFLSNREEAISEKSSSANRRYHPSVEVTLVREWLRSHKAIGIFLFFIITIRLFFT